MKRTRSLSGSRKKIDPQISFEYEEVFGKWCVNVYLNFRDGHIIKAIDEIPNGVIMHKKRKPCKKP